MAEDRIVAVGLLTKLNVDQLGTSLQQLWPVQDVPCFDGLLSTIDDANRKYWRSIDGDRELAAGKKKSPE